MPLSEDHDSASIMIAAAKALWEGSFPLKETFWWYVVAYGFLLNFVTSLLFFYASHKRSKRRLGYFGFCDPNPLQYIRRCGCLAERGPLSWPEGMGGFRTHRSRGLDDWPDFGLK